MVFEHTGARLGRLFDTSQSAPILTTSKVSTERSVVSLDDYVRECCDDLLCINSTDHNSNWSVVGRLQDSPQNSQARPKSKYRNWGELETTT